MEKNLKGTVKWFSLEKAYGFVHLHGTDADYFMHGKDCIDKNLTEGDIVLFDEKEGRKGVVAGNVRKYRYVE